MYILPYSLNFFSSNKKINTQNSYNQNKSLSISRLKPLMCDTVTFSGNPIDSKTKDDTTIQFQQTLKEKLNSSNENELFGFIYNSLMKRADEKKIYPNLKEDIVNNAIVEILEHFNDFSANSLSQNDLIEKIGDIYDGLKVHSKDYETLYGAISLESKLTYDSETPLKDLITEENLPKYLSKPDENQIKKDKMALEKALQGVELTDKEMQFLQDKFQNETHTYVSVGANNNISDTAAARIIHRALFKIRDKNNTLSDEEKTYIQDFQKVFPNFEEKDIKDIIASNYNIFYFTPENILEARMKPIVKEFEKDGLTLKDYIQCCSKQPSLFTLNPQTVITNVDSLVEKFSTAGLTRKNYIKCCIKQPQLLTISSGRIEDNINDFVKKFENEGLTTEKYIKSCTKQPTLFYQSPNTLENNVRTLVKKFENEGLTTEKYIKCCLKSPSLFCFSPDRIENNIKSLVKRFEQDGLSVPAYIQCCIKQPQLFYQSPDTIEQNVRSFVKKFADKGLTTEDYIRCCMKQPALFFQSPDTLEKNVYALVEIFKDKGLTLETYLKCCTKQPSLFCQSATTIENNVCSLVKKFKAEGLTVEDYLQCCISQPSLFCQSSDTIAEHIKAYMYAEKNETGSTSENIMDKILKKNLALSTSTIYLQRIIRPQIKKQDEELSDLKINKIKSNLKEYFENHPQKQFKIVLVQDEMSDNFEKTMKEFCRQEYGRENVFNIKYAA